MPFATILFLLGFGKLIYDLFDKNLRVSTSTVLVVVASGMIFVVALLADLIVQVTRPKHSVLPSAVTEWNPPSHSTSPDREKYRQ